MQRAKLSYLFSIVLMGLVVALGAQEKSAPSSQPLAEVTAEFREKMRKVMAPSGKSYIAELRKLERKLAASGDFKAAIAARDERVNLETFLGDAVIAIEESSATTSEETSPAAPGELEFRDTSANVSDGGSFNDEGLDLSASGAAANWVLGTFEPGGYEILLHYSASRDTTVQVKESFFRLSEDLPSTDGKPSKLVLGTLKITDNSDLLTLVHTGLRSNLIIHSIQLISAKK